MDVARLNFSHGDHADHEAVYKLVREAAKAAMVRSASWPTCRARRSGWAGSPTGPHEWRTGETVTITSDDILGTHDRVSCTYTQAAGARCEPATGCSSTTARSPSR